MWLFSVPRTGFRDPDHKALRTRAKAGIIVGKNEETKGFKVYIPKDQVVVTTPHVQNVETLPDNANEQLRRALEAESEEELEALAQERQRRRATRDSQEEKTEGGNEPIAPQPNADEPATSEATDTVEPEGGESPEDPPAGPRRSSRKKRKSKRRAEADAAPTNLLLAAVDGDKSRFADLPDPKTYKDSLKSADAEIWHRARQGELASHRENGTWTPVKKEAWMTVLHSKWVQKKKREKDGSIERRKARIVACRNEQVYGLHFVLTFAAVLDLPSGKFIVALGLHWGVQAEHFNVPSAYPKAKKEEGLTVYMATPQDMHFTAGELAELGVSSAKDLLLRLDNNLYGLRQAGRLFHQLLVETLIAAGYEQSITDTCVFYKIDAGGTTVVGAYVDDLIVTATDKQRVDNFHSDMKALEVKRLGVIDKFLGMGFTFEGVNKCLIDQEQMIHEMLVKHGLDQANAVRAPIGDECVQTGEDAALLPAGSKGTLSSPTISMFQSLFGSLLWVARCTRPDITYAVHRASRRTHASTVGDYKMAKRIARYLLGTTGVRLMMQSSKSKDDPVQLASYTDADHAGDKEDRKSVSGAMIEMNGMLIAWQCKKQSSVALSTAEAEFVAVAMGAKELLGMRELASELHLGIELPLMMNMDNQAAIKQVENEASSSEQKHVDIKLKFLKDYSKKKIIKPVYVSTKLIKADLLTKSLLAPRLLELRAQIELQ